MNNFMVRVKGGNEQIRKDIEEAFTKQFFEQNCEENELKEKEKYILSEKYVDRYITPYLIRDNDDGDDSLFYSVLCDMNERRDESAGITDCSLPLHNTLSVEFHASDVYFESIENQEFQVKVNSQRRKYREYKIRNKSMLLLFGSCSYVESEGSNGESNTRGMRGCDMKSLYQHIQQNKSDIGSCFGNLEGSFVLIYVHYENGKINIYFFNDQFGMKSFIFFFVKNSIIFTNMYGPFINYDFNYVPQSEGNYLFDDSSVREDLNLIPYDTLFQNSERITNFVKATCKKRNVIKKNLCSGRCINEKVGKHIAPNCIYNLFLLEDRNKIVIQNVKKENCIYTDSYEWKMDNLSLKEHFHNLLTIFEKNKLFRNFSEMQRDRWKNSILTLINEKVDIGKNEKEECPKDGCTFTETKFNNDFVCLYLNLLSTVIKKKMEEFFLHCSEKFDQKRYKKKKKKKERDGEKRDAFGECPLLKKDEMLKKATDREKAKSVGIFFSGGIDSTLLTILTIKNFFRLFKNGYIELINVAFDENAVDRYTSLISYEQIIKLFPNEDIRLVFINVSGEDLIKYERVIYSLISPNNTVMDYNISAALFFANLGKGYICPRNFFKSSEWQSIKQKALTLLNVNYEKNTAIMENFTFRSTGKVQTAGEAEETREENKGKFPPQKCSVCEYVMNKKCVHRCCSACCRKLRYMCFNEHSLRLGRNEKILEAPTVASSKKCTTDIPTATATTNSTTDNGNKSLQSSCGGVYEVKYDERTNEKCLYLAIKKKKILINFELFLECSVHRDKLYDYKKISSLFHEFNEELEKDKEKGEEKGGEKGKGQKREESKRMNNDFNEKMLPSSDMHSTFSDCETPLELEKNMYKEEEGEDKARQEEGKKNTLTERRDTTKESSSDRQYFQNGRSDFIDHFAKKKAEWDKNNFEKIKNLFSGKNRKREEKSKGKDIREKKIFVDGQCEKEEERLNYLSRVFYNNAKSHRGDVAKETAKAEAAVEVEEKYYLCTHQLLFIGSGADELYGGYYRQNNGHAGSTHTGADFKMKEMIKDVRRIWNRNLYRDDRIITFTSASKKDVFYPYLNVHLVNFLFSIPFYLIEAPIESPDHLRKRRRSIHGDGAENGEDVFPSHGKKECNNPYIVSDDDIIVENNLMGEESLHYAVQNMEECYHLYEIMRQNRISKWILRMAIFFLNCKELMFFKKKAIQFGSKSKNITKYMREYVIPFYNVNNDNNLFDANEKKKGDDYYTLLC
ncbi:asparagine synthase, putative [Plasmodium ovale wallikeri]|uniref:Asparagine synthase, putative n=1 Tax=Plasmodium ovale wallikeri TaxID=864142 RepID=A0A1A8ZD68_PLAOA|nr:asparagine synthase, putative [Plasmodium ovale wallikeri]